MFETKETKHLYEGAAATFRGTGGIIHNGFYPGESQLRWFFFSNNSALNGAKPTDWEKVKGDYHYSYAFTLPNYKEFSESIKIHYPWNIPRSAFEEIRVEDIVKLVNPTSKDFRFGGIGIIQNKYGAINKSPEDWRAQVEYVAPDYIRVQFLGIPDSGSYKFARYELELVSRQYTAKDVESWSTSSNGTSKVVVGHTHVANGAANVIGTANANGTSNVIIGHTHVANFHYTNSIQQAEACGFIATPSGHVETLNDDMPLFKRVIVKPNKLPDLE